MYTTLEKTQLSRTTDPERWKAHFLRMKDNHLTKRGRRVLVGSGNGKNPVLKVISPAQESVDIAKSQVQTIKEEEASQSGQKGTKRKPSTSNSSVKAKSSTTTACKKPRKSWKRTPRK